MLRRDERRKVSLNRHGPDVTAGLHVLSRKPAIRDYDFSPHLRGGLEVPLRPRCECGSERKITQWSEAQ